MSDAFENPMQDPALELKVTMLNINAGHNEELMNNCHVLWEYAEYVARVRKYAAEMSLNEAVELAITECINEGILTEFLQHNRAEVYKVSIFEYDKEEEEKKLRKAEFEAGVEHGIEQSLVSLVIKKMKKGKSVEEIADMLEETPEKIQNIYELARNMEPDYDVEKICGQLSG